MKKLNIFYWLITGLFAAFMLFTAIPDILVVPDAKTFMNHLGYPDYFIPLIGYLKVLGSIAIMVPGFPRIKEWAYAGLFFDLGGAVYSQVATDGWQPGIVIMLLPLGFFVASYMLYNKRLELKKKAVV